MAQRPQFNRVWNYISSSLQDFANVLSPYMGGGNNLKAGTKELTLDDTGTLTANVGTNNDFTIALAPGADDFFIRSTDRLELQGGDKLLNNSNTGGHAYLYAGDGSSSDGTADAGDGGRIRIYGGDAGNSVGGDQAYGGHVYIRGGYTTQTNNEGGNVYLYGGSSADNIMGNVIIGNNSRFWVFNENYGTLEYPPVNLSVLPSASLDNTGMRAIINDSTVAASSSFGAIAAGGGSFVVPVFSDGSDWLIG